MPLSKSDLKANILTAFRNVKSSPGPLTAPLMSPIVANQLANAYHKYALAGMAGALKAIVPGQPAALGGPLAAVPLFLGWGPGLLAYWTPVIFAGPGFIPANPTVPAAVVGVTADIVLLLPPNPIKIKTEEEFADKLATALDLWTKKIMVITTTVSVPPVVAPMPLS